MPTETLCLATTTDAGSGYDCQVIATTTEGTYTGLNRPEALFVTMVLLFFVAYQTWDRLFRPGANWHEDEMQNSKIV